MCVCVGGEVGVGSMCPQLLGTYRMWRMFADGWPAGKWGVGAGLVALEAKGVSRLAVR